jgi:predicted metal-dependent phosphoesterase TrpH
VAVARRVGLAGLAITDHNAVGGIREAQEAAGDGFLVLPGTEVSTASGHVLAYGVQEVVPRDLSVADTVERIAALGGVAVAAHPFRFWSGLGGDALGEAPFPAYETSNARTLRRGNARARERAQAARVGETGGSDSHFLDEVARAVTSVDSGASTADDVIQLIGQGKTRSQGLDRGAAGTLRYVPKAVGEWLGRGMRRI